MKTVILALASACAASVGFGGARPAYLDTSLSFEERAADLQGGKLTRFETGLFNDGNGYVADPPDGNNWNSDTGVKMTVRDIAVYTDRPE